MIRLVLGNVGSGKTASIVRRIILNKEKRTWYTNIDIKDAPQNVIITSDMIAVKEVDDKGKTISLKLNTEFWKGLKNNNEKISIVFDEAHTLINSRASGSRINKVMGDLIALVRRLADGGELIFISQLIRRLDVISKEMSTNIDYHMAHYDVVCHDCWFQQYENNENPDKMQFCPRCESANVVKENFIIQVYKFKNLGDYEMWFNYGMKKYYGKYMITDIEDYFPYYDTLQWDNLISEF